MTMLETQIAEFETKEKELVLAIENQNELHTVAREIAMSYIIGGGTDLMEIQEEITTWVHTGDEIERLTGELAECQAQLERFRAALEQPWRKEMKGL